MSFVSGNFQSCRYQSDELQSLIILTVIICNSDQLWQWQPGIKAAENTYQTTYWVQPASREDHMHDSYERMATGAEQTHIDGQQWQQAFCYHFVTYKAIGSLQIASTPVVSLVPHAAESMRTTLELTHWS